MKHNNSIRGLSKLELLELLAEQEQEIQELKQQLEEKDHLLAQRTLCMEQSGNIAQAALALNGVFEAAQKAADQYVESVRMKAEREQDIDYILSDISCQADDASSEEQEDSL